MLEAERAAFPNPWTAEHFLHELQGNPNACCWVIRSGDERIGYACVWLLFEEMRILNLAIARDRQGAGLGRRLLAFAMDHARDQGCKTAQLEVRVSNAVALALYHSLGFLEIGRQRAYYENGEDALLLEAPLSQSFCPPDDTRL